MIAYEWADAAGLSHLSDAVMDKLVEAIDDELLNAVEIGKAEARSQTSTIPDIHAIALVNVSGALVDSGVIVPEDMTRYGEAVRELTAMRDAERQRADAAEANIAKACAGHRETKATLYAAVEAAGKRADAAERERDEALSLQADTVQHLIQRDRRNAELEAALRKIQKADDMYRMLSHQERIEIDTAIAGADGSLDSHSKEKP